jgi:hypothetical protein
VGYQEADLLEVGVLVEEEFDSLTRGQFPLFVLARDALRPSTLKQFVFKRLEFLHELEEMRAVG